MRDIMIIKHKSRATDRGQAGESMSSEFRLKLNSVGYTVQNKWTRNVEYCCNSGDSDRYNNNY